MKSRLALAAAIGLIAGAGMGSVPYSRRTFYRGSPKPKVVDVERMSKAEKKRERKAAQRRRLEAKP